MVYSCEIRRLLACDGYIYLSITYFGSMVYSCEIRRLLACDGCFFEYNLLWIHGSELGDEQTIGFCDGYFTSGRR
jgi:hypothetical protein